MALLEREGIRYLIDVRSQPYSRYHPQYRQANLKVSLEGRGIQYVFMGDSLGGRPADVSCYGEDGRVDYELVRGKDFFKAGIERLRTAYEKGIAAAIMCSESRPGECHRSRLIGSALLEVGIELVHIDEKGGLIHQRELKEGLDPAPASSDLFSGASLDPEGN